MARRIDAMATFVFLSHSYDFHLQGQRTTQDRGNTVSGYLIEMRRETGLMKLWAESVPRLQECITGRKEELVQGAEKQGRRCVEKCSQEVQ